MAEGPPPPRPVIPAVDTRWEYLHGPGAWDANPEVVVLTFTVERRNIDHG